MKILMATMALDIGGAETHIVELTKALCRRGHEVIVVSNGGVYVPEIEAAGVRHYDAPLHRRAVGDMRRSYGILKDIIRREQPDIVHAHARIPAMLCGLLARRMKFPFVTSCHGVYQVSGVLRLLSDWGERTLAVSEDIRDYLVKEYKVPQEHIRLTINGIDTEKFSPEASGGSVRKEFSLGAAPVIGHVSRLDQEPACIARGLIEIAPALDKAIPGVRILITGGGTAFAELQEKAAAQNKAMGRECLVLTGPRTDIRDIMAACDLFVGSPGRRWRPWRRERPSSSPAHRATPDSFPRKSSKSASTPTSAAARTLWPPVTRCLPSSSPPWLCPKRNRTAWAFTAGRW